VQILAVDLGGELLPLIALTFDPPDETMIRKPRRRGRHVLQRRSLADVFSFGALMGAAGYLSFYMAHHGGVSLGAAQASPYATIVLAQYMNILSRRTAGSLFTTRFAANRPLVVALATSLALVVAITNVDAAGTWLGFEPMRWRDWIWSVVGAVAFLLAFEFARRWPRHLGHNEEPSRRRRGKRR
jgi:Ca2+-transporting ATPase